jgi:ubiquinone/menaquinone biosynthesis C-methylase UbiE
VERGGLRREFRRATNLGARTHRATPSARDEHILDVGCGDGKVTAELARAVPKGSVTGIDASPEMIRFARKTFPPANIRI